MSIRYRYDHGTLIEYKEEEEAGQIYTDDEETGYGSGATLHARFLGPDSQMLDDISSFFTQQREQ